VDDLQVGVPQNHLVSDLILENYIWKKFIRESIAAGEIPLWNPYVLSGQPFLANGQHSGLYPFSILFYIMPLVACLWLVYRAAALAGRFEYVRIHAGFKIRQISEHWCRQ
jgi:hypothetical protein